MRAETVHAALLVLIVAGLGLSAFAAYETVYPAAAGICSISPFFSCSKVDQSGHTTTLNVADWKIGIAGFVALLAVDVPLYITWRRDLLQGLVALSGIGVGVSLYLGYVELAVIHALCPVCFSTYLVNAVVFLLSLWLLLSSRGADEKDEDTPESDSPSAGPSPTP
ncbi:MAG: vitamin K epoxide reductase family protein [Thermoplasmata archaeon]|nr:vitamin K epoxide reductase family protein [Thermoplasmata archaeon]